MGVAERNEETLQNLRDLHPSGPEVSLPEPATPMLPTVTTKAIETAIKSFKKASAAGLCGLRADFLSEIQAILPELVRNRFLQAICNLVTLGLNGRIPQCLAPFFSGARLIPLEKPTGGIRPIAIGNVWRRLISKVGSNLVSEEMSLLLRPLQLGVSTPHGSEAIVHTISAMVEEKGLDSKFGLLALDFQNAFNNVSRQVMLEECKTLCPKLFRWMYFCYSRPVNLFYEDVCILSIIGVQQGDPLACLGFALVLNRLLSQMALLPFFSQIALHAWYLDDGNFIAEHEVLRKVLEFVVLEGPKLGLNLRLSKSVIWWPTVSEDWHLYPSTLSQSLESGIKILGSPIGSAAFSESLIGDRVAKISRVMSAALSLPSKHCQYVLLRHCICYPRIAFALRTCPPDQIPNSLAVFDLNLRSAVGDMVGVPLSDDAWVQATLPISLGGLGFTCASVVAPAAFLSSVHQSLDLQKALRNVQDGQFTARNDLVARQSLLESLPQFTDISLSEALTTTRNSQKNLSTELAKVSQSQLLESVSQVHQARLRSCSLPYAGSWLEVLPIKSLQLELPNDSFTRAVKLRLGLPQVSVVRKCSACDNAIMDTLGHHALVCPNRPDRILRHNAIRDSIFFTCQKAALSPEMETHGEISNYNSKPGDVVIPYWIDGRRCLLDVGITNPTNTNVLAHAARETGYAANQYSESKRAKAANSALFEGSVFLPLIAETFGGWHNVAVEQLKRIACSVASQTHQAVGLETQRLFQRLAITIQKHNATMIGLRIPVF